MKKYIKRTKGPVMFLFAMVLFAFMNQQKVYAQWRCPMIENVNGPVVILKADDFISMTDEWQRFHDIIEENNICASIAVITAWAQGSGSSNLINELHNRYYINDLNEEVNRFEYFNHGYAHEGFNGVAFETQCGYIKYAQDIFHNSFGFESHAFCAPGNSFDQNTKAAIDLYNINNDDQLKIWMNTGFGAIDQTGWNSINTFDYGPDYNHLLYGTSYFDTDNSLNPGEFETYYNAGNFNDLPFIVIQLHPGAYKDDVSFGELINIIFFLKSKNALFVTPSYLYNKANNEHYCGDYYGNDYVHAMSLLSAGSSSQCDHTTIYSGADVTFTASKRIELLSGFRSEIGATFKAFITPNTTSLNAPSLKSQPSRNAKLSEVVPVEPEVNVYPNPSKGVLFIRNLSTSNSLIELYNPYGRLLYSVNNSGNQQNVDLTSYPAGVYYLRISGDKPKVIKVIKQ